MVSALDAPGLAGCNAEGASAEAAPEANAAREASQA